MTRYFGMLSILARRETAELETTTLGSPKVPKVRVPKCP